MRVRIPCLFACLLVGFLAMVLAYPEAAFAGPGGTVARAVTKNRWVQFFLVLATIVFLPLILWSQVVMLLARRKTMNALARFAALGPTYEWTKLRKRIADCFLRVHAAWEKEQVQEASDWMTDWYWQNQQITSLNRWEQEGLVNVCHVKKIKKIRPFYFEFHGEEDDPEDTTLIVAITSNMEDFLAEREGGKVVEGSKGYKEVETLWTFVLHQGRWVVSDIEEDDCIVVYSQESRKLPEQVVPDLASPEQG